MPTNPIVMQELLKNANIEKLRSSKKDGKKVLFLAIDFNGDFMENGALAVSGSHGDVERTCKWLYENIEEITKIAVSIDTHNPWQIFHPCWWVDEDGNNPPPFTPISLKDLDDGKWRAVIKPLWSREYIENLEKQGKKVLMIWSYHCLEGTSGHRLENQFSNMLYFHAVAKKSIPIRISKGQDPLTEMYGILKAEYDPKNRININFLNKLSEYDVIVIAGEAKSHCVLETLYQITDYFKNDLSVTGKIYILSDCMSSITGSEKITEAEFKRLEKDFNLNIVESTTFNIKGG